MEESVMRFVAQNTKNMIDEDSDHLSPGVKTEARALKKQLADLEETLKQVEEARQGLNNNNVIHARFTELRRIVYDAEDVVDNYVLKTESSLLSSLSLIRRSYRDSKKLRRLGDQVKEIVASLKGEESYMSKKLTPSEGHGLAICQAHRHADDDIVVGIDEDVKSLVKKLVEQPPTINVLIIVGMGGSGKSTLARNLYNHEDVKKYFKYQAWVSHPKEWNASEEENLLSTLTSNEMKKSGSVWKQQQKSSATVQSLLEKEECLVVLDDVWDWKCLQEMINELLVAPPHSGIFKSKIVITSRQYHPSFNTHLKWDVYKTKLLSDEDSLSLFNKVSINNSERELGREYKSLAVDMLTKCRGLPLAIVALGRLLKKKGTIEEWERVFSQLKEDEGTYLYGPVTDILALSYHELPHHLKPLFLYLGLLVEESISAATLKRMWVAEGFVKNPEQGDQVSPEDTATGYLQELVDHTMVQPVTFTYTGKVKTIRVHNLMRDVSVKIAQEFDFLTLLASHSNHPHSRRAAVSKGSPFPYNNPSLRSLLVFGKSSTGLGVDKEYGTIVNQQGVLQIYTVFEKLKLLRVLDIKGIKTYDGIMPEEIGNLTRLRYLRIRSTNIRKLPKSIGKLRKLLTLDYWDVSGDGEISLPNKFWKLEKLRHLFLPNEMMSSTIADLKLDTLKELQTLCGVKGGDWMLKEMNTLTTSITKLHIQGISKKEQLEKVFHCPAVKNLYALVLDWYGFSASDCIQELLSNEELKIKRLRLLGKAEDKNWLEASKFPSQLGKLELYYTRLEREDTMDALGNLTNLKFLTLAKDSFIGSKWTCKRNTFTSLEELNLSDLTKLEEWTMEEETMQNLKKLSIISCANLQKLPKRLKSIETLETCEIRRMKTTFNRRLRQGEDYEIVQNIRNLTISDSCTSISL